MNALWLLTQSRKFIVGTLAVLGVVILSVIGLLKGLPENTILATIGAITGVAWKLIDAIASEDNSKRENVTFEMEVMPNDGHDHSAPKIPSAKTSN